MDLGIYGLFIAGIARRSRDIAPIKIYCLRARAHARTLDERVAESRFTRGYRALIFSETENPLSLSLSLFLLLSSCIRLRTVRACVRRRSLRETG